MEYAQSMPAVKILGRAEATTAARTSYPLWVMLSRTWPYSVQNLVWFEVRLKGHICERLAYSFENALTGFLQMY